MAAKSISEKDFQRNVIHLLHLNGYIVAHFTPAINAQGNWRTPVAADGKGFPDLVAVRPDAPRQREGRVLFIELKSDTGRVSKEQAHWHQHLISANAEMYVWRPRDWDGLQDIVR